MKKTHVDWLVSEQRILIENYETDISLADLYAMLPRHTHKAIRAHAHKTLGLLRPSRKGEHRATPTWDRMKAMLQAERLTVNELVERLQVSQQRVAELIGLHRGEIYVAERIPAVRRGGQRVPVYAHGSEPDAPMPVTVRQARKLRGQSPFAAAAGLVKAPVGQPGRVYHNLWDDKEAA